MISVDVCYFAAAREARGVSRETLALPDGSTVADVVGLVSSDLPALARWVGHVRFAVNDAFIPEETLLQDGDELSWIPPVSGGSPSSGVFVLSPTRIEAGQACSLLRDAVGLRGGLATFSGCVRRASQGREVAHLEYEAHERMALRLLEGIASEARERWEILDVAVMHRTGRVELGEVAVSIAVSAAHRAPALEACRFVIDRMKEDVPIWKQETATNGDSWWSKGS